MARTGFILFLIFFGFGQTDFITQQKKYARVRKAFSEKEQGVNSNLEKHQLKPSEFQPVYIFPFRMTDENFNRNLDRYAHKSNVISFWDNLKPGYRLFLENNTEINFDVDLTGDYVYLK